MRLFDPPLSEGRPPLGRPSVVTPPTEDAPWPVPGAEGWVWWYGDYGHPRARSGDRRISARNHRELGEKIRKAEGGRHGGPDR